MSDPSGATYGYSGGYAPLSPTRFDLQYTLVGYTLSVQPQSIGNQDVPSTPTMEYWPSVTPPASLSNWPVEWRAYAGPRPDSLVLVASGQFVPNTITSYTFNTFPQNQNYMFVQMLLTYTGGYAQGTPVIKLQQ